MSNSVSNSTVCRELGRMEHTRKKGRESGRARRVLEGGLRVMVTEEIDARDFVFVDECGAHTSLAAIYGYSPRESGCIWKFLATVVRTQPYSQA